MSEFETDTIKLSSQGKKTVDASRRKLTAAMLAGPVVLSTLASKQALGGTIPYHCTISGQMSNSESVRPGASIDCGELGRSPVFWKDRTSCWVLEPITGTPLAETPFNSVFDGDQSASFGDVMAGCAGTTSLERAAAASYLNAYHFNTAEPAYPLTKEQVVALYQAQPAGLQGYFESLYFLDTRSFNCETIVTYECPDATTAAGTTPDSTTATESTITDSTTTTESTGSGSGRGGPSTGWIPPGRR